MENRTKVHVDYGEPKYCSDEVSIDDAIKAAGSDAKTRLLSEFPEAEDIEVMASVSREMMLTVNGRMNKVCAKAFAVGYIPKSNNSQSCFIKDITTTKLYQEITTQILLSKETVVAYRIMYMQMDINLCEGGNYVEFSGKGDIPWEELKDAINSHNQEVINIDPDNLYKDINLSDYAWGGFILLSDGSWLRFNMKYDASLGKRYVGIDRKYSPKLDSIPDSNFKVTISNKGNIS